MKISSRCKEELPLNIFYRYKERYQSVCNPCKKKYNQEKWAEKRRKIKNSGWYLR